MAISRKEVKDKEPQSTTVTDTSRSVHVAIRDRSTGELFARTAMPYMTALVFKAAWEQSHADSDRHCEIET